MTDLPIRLYYLNQNTVLIHTLGFCLFWNCIASVLNIAGLHLMALGSVERHLFVFHNQFISRHRLLLSGLPMAISIIYPLVFYTIMHYQFLLSFLLMCFLSFVYGNKKAR